MKKIISSLTLILILSLSVFATNRIVNVQIQGNTFTKKFVILNLMSYKKGMKVNVDELAKAQNILMSSGLFSNVYMNLEATNDDYVLVVSVEEKNHISPIVDLVKGVGIKESDLFGLGVQGEASIRFFNLSPFEIFAGGYSLDLSSQRAFGTPFSFEIALSNLKKMQWITSQSKFQYDLARKTVGAGYVLSENSGFMANYIHENVSISASEQFAVDAVSLDIYDRPIQMQNKRTYAWWNLHLEKGINGTKYSVFTLDGNLYHRMIGQVYYQARLYGVLNLGNAPFTRKIYFGDTYNLKGYDTKEFDLPFMLLFETRIGVPLTSSFEISKSPELSLYTPELIPQIAFMNYKNISLESFKASIGLGVKINSPFGVFEPEIFFGKELGFYLEMK